MSAAADAADERYSDGETWGSDQSRWIFYYGSDEDDDDTIRKTRHAHGRMHGRLLFIPSVLAPGLESRTSRNAAAPDELIRTMNPPRFVRVPRGASRVPTRPQRGSRVAEGVSSFSTGFGAISEGADAINGRARGLARLATTFESTGHAASVLDLSCAIARPRV